MNFQTILNFGVHWKVMKTTKLLLQDNEFLNDYEPLSTFESIEKSNNLLRDR